MSNEALKQRTTIEENPSLKKALSYWTTTTIVVGTVLGTGVLVKPGEVLETVADPVTALLAWVVGGLISMAGGLTLAEIGVRIPRTGGIYEYVEEIYGSLAGFLCGWTLTFIYGPTVIAALSLYFADMACNLLGWPETNAMAVGLSALAFIAAVNTLGAGYSGGIQKAITVIKLIPILLIAGAGIVMGSASIGGPVTLTPTGSFGSAVLLTFWAYDGWAMVVDVAGEMKNPVRDLPRSIVSGLCIIIVVYLTVNLGLMKTFSGSEIVAMGGSVGFNAAIRLFHPGAGSLVSIAVLISLIGCLNGIALTSTRIPYAMALRNRLPFSNWIARSSKRSGSPTHAILLESTLAAALMLVADAKRLSTYAVFSFYIFFTAAFFGIIILRRRETQRVQGVYRVPLYPVVPLIAFLGGLYVLASTVIDQPPLALYSVAGLLLGLPIYFLRSRKGADSVGRKPIP